MAGRGILEPTTKGSVFGPYLGAASWSGRRGFGGRNLGVTRNQPADSIEGIGDVRGVPCDVLWVNRTFPMPALSTMQIREIRGIYNLLHPASPAPIKPCGARGVVSTLRRYLAQRLALLPLLWTCPGH